MTAIIYGLVYGMVYAGVTMISSSILTKQRTKRNLEKLDAFWSDFTKNK